MTKQFVPFYLMQFQKMKLLWQNILKQTLRHTRLFIQEYLFFGENRGMAAIPINVTAQFPLAYRPLLLLL